MHECVSVPCLHLFQYAGFIVSERLFNKGLQGFKMNLVSLSFSVPSLILVRGLKITIRAVRPSKNVLGLSQRHAPFF